MSQEKGLTDLEKSEKAGLEELRKSQRISDSDRLRLSALMKKEREGDARVGARTTAPPATSERGEVVSGTLTKDKR